MSERPEPAPPARQRLRDAARLLPLAGAFLFLMPGLWAPNAPPGTGTAHGGLYLFAVWFGLILGAALLSRPLSAEAEREERGPREG